MNLNLGFKICARFLLSPEEFFKDDWIANAQVREVECGGLIKRRPKTDFGGIQTYLVRALLKQKIFI